jgi:hypothetical protein
MSVLMNLLTRICLLATIGLLVPHGQLLAQDSGLAQIKERELEAVRDKISQAGDGTGPNHRGVAVV